MEFLTSETEQPYEVIIEALGTLQAKEAFSLVEPFLHHSSERVQCAAARYAYLITHEPQPQYIERIIKNLSHENMYLRWAAAFDLRAIGHQASAQAIIKEINKIGFGITCYHLRSATNEIPIFVNISNPFTQLDLSNALRKTPSISELEGYFHPAGGVNISPEII